MSSSEYSSISEKIPQNHFNSAKQVVSKWAEWKKEYANCSFDEVQAKASENNK